MSFSIDINDRATPALREFMDSVSGERLNPVVGRAGANLFQRHFLLLEQSHPNKLGGKRTHFWAQAARGTNYTVLPDGVAIGVNQVGIRQRYQGGRIEAKNVHFLTIPACAEAYGKRAREFNHLRFIILKRGGPALVEAEASEIKIGKRGIKHTASRLGTKVYYWLRTSVVQEPDPSTLPTDEQIIGAIDKAVTDRVNLLMSRSKS